MTKVLKLAFLGQMQLSQAGAPLAELVSGKAQALLCYLAVSGRPHSRQALAGLLWGELPEADARRNLRHVLMTLRQFVGPNLDVTHQALAFNQDSDYWLDVEQFRASLGRATPEPDQWRRAVALYRGDFLEDFHVRQAPAFEDWVRRQREQLREQALQTLYDLAVHDGGQGAYDQGLDYARRLLRLDPVREDGYRQLMLLLALSGQRSAALAQYEACRRVLAAELGIEPSPETDDLYQRISAGQISGAATPLTVTITPTAAPAPPATSAPPPFIVGPPVTYPARFFGRERELKRLFNLFQRLPLQNAAVVGPRRSGKTSLLHYLKSITTAPAHQLRPGQAVAWLPTPEHYRWIYVDFQDPRLGDCANLLRYLLAQLDLPAPEACDLDYFMDAVSEGLQAPAVVLFDEIGVALQRYPELDDAFWETLRSLATNHTGGRLAFVLAAPEPPEQLAQYSGLGSPFFNIFGYTAYLGPLTEEEARDLIASSPIPFPDADVAWILAESGRWPILLQILCRERLLALEEGETGDAWRQDALRQLAPFASLKIEG